jgi:hypothetical protein
MAGRGALCRMAPFSAIPESDQGQDALTATFNFSLTVRCALRKEHAVHTNTANVVADVAWNYTPRSHRTEPRNRNRKESCHDVDATNRHAPRRSDG